jgi:hypothetical protein
VLPAPSSSRATRLVEDVLLRELCLRRLAHFRDPRPLLVSERGGLLAAVGVLLSQARHGDFQRALRCFVVFGHRPII